MDVFARGRCTNKKLSSCCVQDPWILEQMMDQERDPASAMYTLPAQFVDLARERLRRPTDWLWLMRQLFRFFLGQLAAG